MESTKLPGTVGKGGWRGASAMRMGHHSSLKVKGAEERIPGRGRGPALCWNLVGQQEGCVEPRGGDHSITR